MNYDKLKNLETFDNPFSFICPSCKCNGLEKGKWEMRPIGISYKPMDVDNSDLDIQLRRTLDALPNLRQAILSAVSNTIDYKPILIYCNNCNTPISNVDNITKSDVTKWLNKNIPFVMNLKLGADEIERRKQSNNRPKVNK